jgi:hypothetical protein
MCGRYITILAICSVGYVSATIVATIWYILSFCDGTQTKMATLQMLFTSAYVIEFLF